MITEDNISLIIQICTLVGIGWAVYNSVRKPQEKGELTDAVFSERFTQFDRELANLRDNHIHSLGLKLDSHVEAQTKNEMQVCEKLARIETKIEVLIQK
jgi:hypothetical protein